MNQQGTTHFELQYRHYLVCMHVIGRAANKASKIQKKAWAATRAGSDIPSPDQVKDGDRV
jgi:hypothetical protein